MEVVYSAFFDVRFFVDVLYQMLDIDFLGRSFHQDRHTVLGNWGDGKEDNYGKYKCANRINDSKLWEEVNNERCNQHSNAQKHVAKGVQECRVKVNVSSFLFWDLYMSMLFMFLIFVVVRALVARLVLVFMLFLLFVVRVVMLVVVRM